MNESLKGPEAKRDKDPKEVLIDQYESFWKNVELVSSRLFGQLRGPELILLDDLDHGKTEDAEHWVMDEFQGDKDSGGTNEILFSQNPYEYDAIMYGALTNMLRRNEQDFVTPHGNLPLGILDGGDRRLRKLVGDDSEASLLQEDGEVKLATIYIPGSVSRHYDSLLEDFYNSPLSRFLGAVVGRDGDNRDNDDFCPYMYEFDQWYKQAAETGDPPLELLESRFEGDDRKDFREPLFEGEAQWIHQQERPEELVNEAYMLSMILRIREEAIDRAYFKGDVVSVHSVDIDEIISNIFTEEQLATFKELHKNGVRPMNQEQLVGYVVSELQSLE